jgi:hypothetical protein
LTSLDGQGSGQDEPEVECLAKGKVGAPNESGMKVSVAEAANEGVALATSAMPGLRDD